MKRQYYDTICYNKRHNKRRKDREEIVLMRNTMELLAILTNNVVCLQTISLGKAATNREDTLLNINSLTYHITARAFWQLKVLIFRIR